MDTLFAGIDIGSVTVKHVLCEGDGSVVASSGERVQGDPIALALAQLQAMRVRWSDRYTLGGIGVTGSGRHVIGNLLDTSLIVNEIVSNAEAAIFCNPDVRTVFEIGGQDSKVIVIRDRQVVDFALNTLCAAGTGSFLDHQAARIGIPVDRFGDYFERRTEVLPVSSGCAVFAETDMIRYQQLGQPIENIVGGLLRGLVRNYLNNVARGKEIATPLLFMGGVAKNRGMVESFNDELPFSVIVPDDPQYMGAMGAALLAIKGHEEGDTATWKTLDIHVERRTRICRECSMECLLVEFQRDDGTGIITGDRCEKWSMQNKR
jgi:predicted CoA-substrate-specific enzyme activase